MYKGNIDIKFSLCTQRQNFLFYAKLCTTVTRIERKLKLARALSARVEMVRSLQVFNHIRSLWLNFASEVIMVLPFTFLHFWCFNHMKSSSSKYI